MTRSAQHQQQSAQLHQQEASSRPASHKQSSTPTTPVSEHAGVKGHVATHQEIAECAYGIYSQKGRAKGQCQQNWHEAEHELRRQQAAAENSNSASSTTDSKFKR